MFIVNTIVKLLHVARCTFFNKKFEQVFKNLSTDKLIVNLVTLILIIHLIFNFVSIN